MTENPKITITGNTFDVTELDIYKPISKDITGFESLDIERLMATEVSIDFQWDRPRLQKGELVRIQGILCRIVEASYLDNDEWLELRVEKVREESE